MSVLYQAGTCHRKCHGGAHVLESLCGRAYNLTAAATQLASTGYYDEALNLARSIGEISNLISLSVLDSGAMQRWLALGTSERIRHFSPAAVRKMLELQPNGAALMYANRDWYSRFGEECTHITPQTKPNAHDSGSKIGGIHQPAGISLCLNELAALLTFIAMAICRYFKFDDLFAEIGDRIGAEKSTTKGAKGDS